MKTGLGILALALTCTTLAVVQGTPASRGEAVLEAPRAKRSASRPIQLSSLVAIPVTPRDDEADRPMLREDAALGDRFARRVREGSQDLMALFDQHMTLEQWERSASALVRSWGPEAHSSLETALRASGASTETGESRLRERLAAGELARHHMALFGDPQGRLGQAFVESLRMELMAFVDQPGGELARSLAMIQIASLGPTHDALRLLTRLDLAGDEERTHLHRALARSPHSELQTELAHRIEYANDNEMEALLRVLADRKRHSCDPASNFQSVALLKEIALDRERSVSLRQRALMAVESLDPDGASTIADDLARRLESGMDDELARASGRPLLGKLSDTSGRLYSITQDPTLPMGTRMSVMEALVDTATAQQDRRRLTVDLLQVLRETEQAETRKRVVHALAALDCPEVEFASSPEFAKLLPSFRRAVRLRGTR